MQFRSLFYVPPRFLRHNDTRLRLDWQKFARPAVARRRGSRTNTIGPRDCAR